MSRYLDNQGSVCWYLGASLKDDRALAGRGRPPDRRGRLAESAAWTGLVEDPFVLEMKFPSCFPNDVKEWYLHLH